MKNGIRHAFILSGATVAVLVTGCASVAVTDDAIGQRTAAALGIEQSSFTISNRQDDGVRSSYAVKTKDGRTYSCYVTGSVSYIGRAVSDAICTEIGMTPKQAGKPMQPVNPRAACNALLKAAGKC